MTREFLLLLLLYIRIYMYKQIDARYFFNRIRITLDISPKSQTLHGFVFMQIFMTSGTTKTNVFVLFFSKFYIQYIYKGMVLHKNQDYVANLMMTDLNLVLNAEHKIQRNQKTSKSVMYFNNLILWQFHKYIKATYHCTFLFISCSIPSNYNYS